MKKLIFCTSAVLFGFVSAILMDGIMHSSSMLVSSTMVAMLGMHAVLPICAYVYMRQEDDALAIRERELRKFRKEMRKFQRERRKFWREFEKRMKEGK